MLGKLLSAFEWRLVTRCSDLVKFGGLVDRYIREALPERKGTALRYRSWLVNHIKPRWQDVTLPKVKPLLVETWIKDLQLAPKSKGHFAV